MNIGDFLPPQPPAVSTGVATDAGIAVAKEQYSGSPRLNKGGRTSPGQSVGVIKEGRIPVILFTGGFHTP